jgi:hypothetical protein
MYVALVVFVCLSGLSPFGNLSNSLFCMLNACIDAVLGDIGQLLGSLWNVLGPTRSGLGALLGLPVNVKDKCQI